MTRTAEPARGDDQHRQPPVRLGRGETRSDAAGAAILAAGFALVAFVATGGVALAANTWTEIVLTVLGAVVAIVMLVAGPRARAGPGAVAIGLFACLAALTALSVLWSVQPESSWIEAGRTVSYLAVFAGGAAAARLFGDRWRALVGAVAIAATVISGYALLVKVFPATFDPSDPFGRLRAPFDYWNAAGLIAAMGLPPCLWVGARLEGGRWPRALSIPAISILLSVIVLSYSRGALLVAVVGVGCWFATVPLRLRGALVLATGALGAAGVTIYASATHALTHDQVPLAERSSAGHTFGLVLLLTVVLMSAAGFLVAIAMDKVVLPSRPRRRIATALLIAVAAVPIAGLLGLAASSRGFTGEVSHIFSTLTNTSINSGAKNTPTRLIKLGNTRGRYWSEGVKVGEHALLKGVGALGYATAVTRYTSDTRIVPHAHSFVIQTFADFGLIGIAVSCALLIAWCMAVRRTLSDHRPREPAERAGLLTLLAVVLTFGVHSAIDWTWFVPGTAVPALLCAGWLAGRGPVGGPSGLQRPRRRLLDSPGLVAAVTGVTVLALLCTWAMWQPLRASNATADAIVAFGGGDTRAAVDDARAAAGEDPVTVDPLFELAAIYSAAGDRSAARAELLRAVDRQPENPQTWLMLGQFDLRARRARSALVSLERARRLDLGSPVIAQAVAQAKAEQAQRG